MYPTTDRMKPTNGNSNIVIRCFTPSAARVKVVCWYDNIVIDEHKIDIDLQSLDFVEFRCRLNLWIRENSDKTKLNEKKIGTSVVGLAIVLRGIV